jgi:hypothetical protein
MKSSLLLSVAGGLLALSLQANAVNPKPIDPNATSIQAMIPANASAPAAVLNVGFEPGEGFSPGFLGTQGGWSTFAASSAQPVINATGAISGSQDLQIAEDASIASGSNTGGFSPDLGPQDITKPSSMSLDVLITATGGADYDVAPQAPSQMFLSARVKFSFLGNIQILDDTGGGLGFEDTGISYPVNTPFNLRIDLDPVANSLTYYINDTLIYTSVAGVFAATQMEQIVVLSDNFHLGEVGQFDNLAVNTDASGVPFVPPTELPFLSDFGLLLAGLMLAFAGLVAIRR